MTKKEKSNIDIISPYILSVQVSLNGLSFCILDNTENNIVYLQEYAFEKQLNPIDVESHLREEFSSNEQLQGSFNKVHLIHQNNICTFVPKAMYNEDELANYLKFNNKIFDSDYFTSDEIIAKDIMAVYVPFVNINNYFFELFGSFEYQHASTVLVSKLLQQATAITDKLYCHISGTSFELIYIKNGDLHFFNSFEFQTKEDYMYYVLFTIEQLKLDASQIDFILLGKIGLDDELYSITYEYIKNISFGSRATQFIFRDPEQKPRYGYDYFALLNSF